MAGVMLVGVQQARAQFVWTNVTGLTLASAGSSNLPASKIIIAPVHYPPGGVNALSTPMPLFVYNNWSSGAAVGYTNQITLTFANSADGTTNTLDWNNTWAVKLISTYASNALSSGNMYPTGAGVFVNPTNFAGAKGFALISIAVAGGTNSYTNNTLITGTGYNY